MAITAIPVRSDLLIYVRNDLGTGTIQRKYADVKPSAANADVYDVAYGPCGLARLQARPVTSVQRTQVVELEEA